MEKKAKKRRWPAALIAVLILLLLYYTLGALLLWGDPSCARVPGRVFDIDAAQLESASIENPYVQINFESEAELSAFADTLNGLRWYAWLPQLVSRGGWEQRLTFSAPGGNESYIFTDNCVRVGDKFYFLSGGGLAAYRQAIYELYQDWRRDKV